MTSPEAVHHHVAAAHHLLVAVPRAGISRRVPGSEDAALQAGAGRTERLWAVVVVQVPVHTERRRGSFPGTDELPGLGPTAGALIVSRRDTRQGTFSRAVTTGAARGVATTSLVVEAARSAVSACAADTSRFAPTRAPLVATVARRHPHPALDTVAYREGA